MIIASMCTIPVRKETFKQAAQRVLHQQTRSVTRLHVWLNGYSEVPGDFPEDPRLIYHLEPANPGPWIRYRAADLELNLDVLATLDDDLQYSTHYIERGCEELSRHKQDECISFGGIRWDCLMPVREMTYIESRNFYGLGMAVEFEQQVALPLGALSFYRAAHVHQMVDLRLGELETNDDMMVGWQLQQRRMKIVCCPSPQNWIEVLPISQEEHALAVRDKELRYRAFRKLVDQLGFDPTAGHLAEVMQKPGRILVLANICPPLAGFEILDGAIRQLCTEDVSVHLLAPTPASLIGQVQRYVNTPYEIHAVSMPEPGGRLDNFAPVQFWRNWRVQTGSRDRWQARLHSAVNLLQPTRILRYQDGQFINLSRDTYLAESAKVLG